jgi:thioredoxin 1
MPIEVNSETFEKEVLQADRLVLVDFWGPRCAPCLALMPQVEELEEKYRDKIKLTKVDASKNRRLCLNLKVMGLPTFLFYREGKELSRLSGGELSIADIEESLKKLVGALWEEL